MEPPGAPEIPRAYGLGDRRAEREGDARQLLGELPEPARRLLVARGRAAPDDLRVPALLAQAVGADVGVAGQILGRREERGQRAHLLTLGPDPVADGQERVLDHVLGAVLEVRRRIAGVRAGHANARPRVVEAALE